MILYLHAMKMCPRMLSSVSTTIPAPLVLCSQVAIPSVVRTRREAEIGEDSLTVLVETSFQSVIDLWPSLSLGDIREGIVVMQRCHPTWIDPFL